MRALLHNSVVGIVALLLRGCWMLVKDDGYKSDHITLQSLQVTSQILPYTPFAKFTMHSTPILVSLGVVALASALPASLTPTIIPRSASTPFISLDYSTEVTFATKNTVFKKEVPLTDISYQTHIGPVLYIRSTNYHINTHCIFETPKYYPSELQVIDAEAGVYMLQLEEEITSVSCRSGGEIKDPHTTVTFRAANGGTVGNIDIPNDGIEHAYEQSAIAGTMNQVVPFDNEAIQYCDFKGPNGWLASPNEDGTFAVPTVITGFKCAPAY
ncbi:hypothetical protein B0J14DRAFT_604538 [Halenospora varia]|nr:hypothetical protein B0J14DRAFT_604538 [Halenospora varia]